MKKLTIENEEYTLEYTIGAAYNTEMVEKTILMQTGAYLMDDVNKGSLGLAYGSAKALSEIPKLCSLYFNAGLQEHHKLKAADSDRLMFMYMKENNLNFTALYKELQEVLNEDGFFEIIGLTEMLAEQNKEIEKSIKQAKAIKKKATQKK